MLRFANALQDNKLLDAQATKLLKTGDIATPIGPIIHTASKQTPGMACDASGRPVVGREQITISTFAPAQVTLWRYSRWIRRLVNGSRSLSSTAFPKRNGYVGKQTPKMARKSSSPPTSSATCSFWYAYPGTARGHLQDVQEVFGSRWLFVVDKPG
ncbi:MAG TPA: hypothetical protein VHZ55_17950, partial [Bryobacteraceae bacterium]|nr:hypothetical protein [Bryobacteraceae bacterium]